MEINLLKKDLYALIVNYKDIAGRLSVKRQESAKDFDLLIMQSLKSLKLENAIFKHHLFYEMPWTFLIIMVWTT